ncbi:hypothetical protein COO60DRAFT_1517191 [Scenedesmus sp. NREL 46B-D3]|nr:hypothetical protein COO60DRAFT_1517191 [Scenedesmus sp. NREL 46B-D3]
MPAARSGWCRSREHSLRLEPPAANRPACFRCAAAAECWRGQAHSLHLQLLLVECGCCSAASAQHQRHQLLLMVTPLRCPMHCQSCCAALHQTECAPAPLLSAGCQGTGPCQRAGGPHLPSFCRRLQQQLLRCCWPLRCPCCCCGCLCCMHRDLQRFLLLHSPCRQAAAAWAPAKKAWCCCCGHLLLLLLLLRQPRRRTPQGQPCLLSSCCCCC